MNELGQYDMAVGLLETYGMVPLSGSSHYLASSL